jgi:hypothetical protein
MHICAQCQKSITGKAHIFEDHEVVHEACMAARDKTRRGLVHKCPQCGGRGRVPTGQRRYRAAPPDYSHGPSHPAFAGSEYLSIDDGPEMGPCTLCDSEGFLAKPPTPIVETRQTGWRR